MTTAETQIRQEAIEKALAKRRADATRLADQANAAGNEPTAASAEAALPESDQARGDPWGIITDSEGRVVGGTFYEFAAGGFEAQRVPADHRQTLLDGVRSAYGKIEKRLLAFVADAARSGWDGKLSDLEDGAGLLRSEVRHASKMATQRVKRSFADGYISEADHRSISQTLDKTSALFSRKIDTAYNIIREIISEEETVDYEDIPEAKRWEMLDQFAADFPGAPVSEYAKRLFPDRIGSREAVSRREAPEAAPKLWSEREPGDTPASFVRKHYGVWRDGVWDRDGLTKPALRQADLQLYNALANWERRHPEDTLNLPTLKEENDRWVERVKRGDESLDGNLRSYHRFTSAAGRRTQKD